MTDDFYEVHLDSDVMIPMRDGVRLATDIYRPARNGRPVEEPFPVILERTPYGKAEVSRSEITVKEPKAAPRARIAEYFARHGYVVAYQDVRGRYASEGTFRKYLDDGPDGYDTVEWIAAQPWCDGKVGMMGLSYSAHTQAAAASLAPPHLACLLLDSGGFSNAYRSGIRQGGAFELKQATWAYKQARLSPEAAADPVLRAALEAEDITDWFTRMPWKRGHSPLRHLPDYEDYLFEQWENGTFDEFWQQPGIWAEGFYEAFSDVPMIHMSSWYDPYAKTAPENYVGLSRLKKGPVRLVMGPWTHGDRSLTYAGDVDFGPDSTLDGSIAEDHRAFRLRWFDRWLKGRDNGVDAEPAVRLFVMGGGSGRRNAVGRLEHGGRWRSDEDWPLPGTRFVQFYFHGDGSLSQEKPAADAPSLSYDYDPRHSVPTIGGAISSGEPVMAAGAYDQVEGPRFFGSREPYLPLAARHDVLVFQTPPLGSDLEVVGPIRFRLWIASTAPDTDFTAKLIDVYPANADYPKGFAMNLTSGILRCRYRESWEYPTLMHPGEVYEIEIEPFPTANLFKAGHRLRVEISSSNFPHFDLNTNTGEPEGRARRMQVATNTVFVDAARPSGVVLPIAP